MSLDFLMIQPQSSSLVYLSINLVIHTLAVFMIDGNILQFVDRAHAAVSSIICYHPLKFMISFHPICRQSTLKNTNIDLNANDKKKKLLGNTFDSIAVIVTSKFKRSLRRFWKY